MVTYWRSTMMGNASKDPFWRAVVAEEVHRFPTLQQTIETTCTKCHAPMGYKEAIFNGADKLFNGRDESRSDCK